jgi:hypothetical protein
MLRIRIRDPVSFRTLNPGSGIRKISKSGSGKNITDHIPESLETIFPLKILQFFDADPESFLTLEKFGSGINIPDPA